MLAVQRIGQGAHQGHDGRRASPPLRLLGGLKGLPGGPFTALAFPGGLPRLGADGLGGVGVGPEGLDGGAALAASTTGAHGTTPRRPSTR
jgi:hypothetical protein